MTSFRYQQDPVYMQADGQWCFLDCTGKAFFGPYPTQKEAYDTLNQYLVWLNEQQLAQAAPTPEPDTTVLEKATAEYLALRAQKAELNEQHRLACAEVDESMALAEAFLLDYLNKTGLKNFSTADATVYTEVSYQPQIGDKGALMDFIRAAKMPELLQARVSSTALKQYIDQGNEMPPGLKVNQERVVRVRTK